jgi:soluble cytochrome b562
MKYTDLTQEQKESISPRLKEMFEEQNELVENCLWFENLEIEEKVNEFIKTWCSLNYSYLVDIDENEGQRLRTWIRIYALKEKIKGYQEGLKVAIKQIDEEIEFLEGKINVKEMTIDATSLSINIVANSYDEYAHKCFDYEPIIKMIKSRIDALKAKRDKLQFEVELQ